MPHDEPADIGTRESLDGRIWLDFVNNPDHPALLEMQGIYFEAYEQAIADEKTPFEAWEHAMSEVLRYGEELGLTSAEASTAAYAGRRIGGPGIREIKGEGLRADQLTDWLLPVGAGLAVGLGIAALASRRRASRAATA